LTNNYFYLFKKPLVYLTGKSDAESGKNCKPTQIPTDLSMTGFKLVPVAQRTKFNARQSSAFGRDVPVSQNHF